MSEPVLLGYTYGQWATVLTEFPLVEPTIGGALKSRHRWMIAHSAEPEDSSPAEGNWGVLEHMMGMPWGVRMSEAEELAWLTKRKLYAEIDALQRSGRATCRHAHYW